MGTQIVLIPVQRVRSLVLQLLKELGCCTLVHSTKKREMYMKL